MFTYYNIEDINSISDFSNYKLCYIGEVPKSFYDYTPDAKAYRETDEWKEQDKLRSEKIRRNGYLLFDDSEFAVKNNPIIKRGSEIQEYPNPDYQESIHDYCAYFTSIDLKNQWGDEWDDAPYEYNGGMPYDFQMISPKQNEHTILGVRFHLDKSKMIQPKDWGREDSFSIQSINSGAIPWIYLPGSHKKCNGICIHAGCNPFTFKQLLEEMKDRLIK